MPKKPTGVSKSEWRIEKARILRERRKALAEARRYLGRAGTAETLAQVEGTHTGSLAQLERNGTITKDQREWTVQIANVHRSIEADVGVKVASLEARVDESTRSPAIAERIHRVRMHRAYAIWRDLLPTPKTLVLDMVVGDAIGYTVAARRHRVHNRRAKRVLMESINRWPLCVARAFSIIGQRMVNAMNQAIAPRYANEMSRYAFAPAESYEAARRVEAERVGTDEPYLLPPVDPEFWTIVAFSTHGTRSRRSFATAYLVQPTMAEFPLAVATKFGKRGLHNCAQRAANPPSRRVFCVCERPIRR
jgi:hypothetical protein